MWAELDANPWMFVPTMFAARPLDASLTLPGPGEPGPFSLADPEETIALLESCGFRDVDVARQEKGSGAGRFHRGHPAPRPARVQPLYGAMPYSGGDGGPSHGPGLRRGDGPRPGLDLTSNRSLHEALDEGVPLDRQR